MNNLWLEMARGVQIGACLLILAVFAFDAFVAGASAMARDWKPIARLLLALGLPAAVVSGAAWLAWVIIDLLDLPASEALTLPNLRRICTHTHFGALWELRSMFCLATCLIALVFIAQGTRASRILGLAGFIAASLLAASLAWAGHAGAGRIWWHPFVDGLHLLIAGFWPIGLLPFALLLGKLRRRNSDDARLAVRALVGRFSIISIFSVILLSGTGLATSYYLVGTIGNLTHSRYGRVLILKLACFTLMIAIGAVNLFCLKPRILSDRPGTSHAAGWLQVNVAAEVAMGAIILALVAILGMLPPAAG